jgi:hypothetical protein
MDGYYPISALAHGQALNITVMSYAGGLYFGFTACHDRVPSVQRLAVYTGEALDELERVFAEGGRQRQAGGVGQRSAAARKRKSKTGGSTQRVAKPTARRSSQRAARAGS